MTKTKRSKKKSTKKRISKKQEETLKDMQETRNEDSVRLRKKAEEFIVQVKEDRKKLIETKKLREEQLQTLNIQLLKNIGALDILNILLGIENGK